MQGKKMQDWKMQEGKCRSEKKSYANLTISDCSLSSQSLGDTFIELAVVENPGHWALSEVVSET